MRLGSDVSGLSTTAATAAARGLSIVVPCITRRPGSPFCTSGSAALRERLGAPRARLRGRLRRRRSADATLSIARGLPADALDVQVVSLSRNFGKEAALMAGLDHARRGAVLFMDGDGQHPPDLVEKLVSYWIKDGYDVVYTAKANRDNDRFLRRLAVHGFYALINWGARQKIPQDAGDFRLLSPRAAAALRQLPERNRFFRGSRPGSAFARSALITNPPRAPMASPRSARPLDRTFHRGADVVLGGAAAVCQPARRVACNLGVSVWSFDPVGNLDHRQIGPRLSLAGGRLMTIGGVQLIMIGIVGEYIGKILSELKARPIYFVAEHTEKRAETESSASITERTAAE